MDTNTEKIDLTINGFGMAPGGDYASVRISGRGKITGDMTGDDFIINGSGDAQRRSQLRQAHHQRRGGHSRRAENR